MTELPAGRELDALIAEKVMGRVVTHPEQSSPGYLLEWSGDAYEVGGARTLPSYSTDIADAWEVVAKLETGRPHRQVRLSGYNVDEWFCDVALFLGEDRGTVWGEGNSAPLAICRAALKAVAP